MQRPVLRVAKQLNEDENQAVFLHCYGHALNLAVGDSVKNSKLLIRNNIILKFLSWLSILQKEMSCLKFLKVS